jgi:hypothetical protein
MTRMIGVSGANAVAVGSQVGPARRTPGRIQDAKFAQFLEKAGYKWAGHQAEHVTDLSLGGVDSFDNLWPLDKARNKGPKQKIDLEAGKEVGMEGSKAEGAKPITDERFIGSYFKVMGVA